jgi:hypothetical protein
VQLLGQQRFRPPIASADTRRGRRPDRSAEGAPLPAERAGLASVWQRCVHSPASPRHPGATNSGGNGHLTSVARATMQAPMSFLKRSLVRQERWTAHEEHREGRQTDFGHAVFAIAARAFALIRQTCADLLQSRDEGTQGIQGGTSQRCRRAASPERHPRFGGAKKAVTCCKSDSLSPGSAPRRTDKCASFAVRTAAAASSCLRTH